jgi:NAD-dependent DNA ligase
VKAKESSWSLTSDLIAMDVKYLDGLKAEYESPARQEFPELDQAIKKRQDELKEVLKKISDQDAAFQADKERLQTQLEQLTSEKDKIERKTRDDASVRLSHINQLEDRIRELLELDLHWMVDRDAKTGKIIGKAGLDPDGTVQQADGPNLKVIIDKGAKDHVFPGLLFEVFSYDRGAYVDKGKIEIIEVQEGISTGRMLVQTDAKRNPIGAGDFIGNPVFDARKPKVFVVAGEFKHYNKEDLEAFIRRTGGVVWPALGPGADFLVAGERSDHEQAAARQYPILAMREDDLLEYVQTTFPPKDKGGAPAAAAPAAAAPVAAAADAK